MQHIGCYDDTNDAIESICEDLDLTEPELVDMLLEIVSNSDDPLGEVIRQHIEF